MRNAIVIGLAIIAVLAGGVWALGQFGGGLTGGVGEPQAPIVREPEIVVAEAPPQPAEANPPAALSTTPVKPAAKPAPTPAQPAKPAPAPATAEPATTTPETPTPAEPAPAPVETPATTPAKPSLSTVLDGKLKLPPLPTLPGQPKLQTQLEAQPAAPAQAQTQAAEAPAEVQSPAPAPPQTPPQAQARIATPAEPAAAPQARSVPPEPTVTVQQAPTVMAAPAGLEAQFKSRKVTYNRPPQKLALDKAVDVSLVINATENENAGQEALQGFPGTIVERDVDLSDIVSAQLTGVGFDITSQTVERQKLSGKVLNRWAWRVTPTEIGEHTLILEIFGYASGSLDAEPLDAYRDVIVVEVQQFDQIVSWAKGVQPLFAVLAALAGIGSAIFAFLRFREEKKQTRKMGE
ncbi:MAG TPA: hypothetical protein PLN33_14400 [Hyphomonadaceae bacterium]|nr:hypothetical protein [Hyphomonadaceae bacterium]HPN04631.1 hypothetical protein [Hyphomonadaceae bacterium]